MSQQSLSVVVPDLGVDLRAAFGRVPDELFRQFVDRHRKIQ